MYGLIGEVSLEKEEAVRHVVRQQVQHQGQPHVEVPVRQPERPIEATPVFAVVGGVFQAVEAPLSQRTIERVMVIDYEDNELPF